MIRLWNWDSNAKEFLEDVKSPFKHHTYAVNEVRFSPQGTMLATGSTDGTAAIWDLAVRFFYDCEFLQILMLPNVVLKSWRKGTIRYHVYFFFKFFTVITYLDFFPKFYISKITTKSCSNIAKHTIRGMNTPLYSCFFKHDIIAIYSSLVSDLLCFV